MKQGTNYHLKVVFDGLAVEDIREIAFGFSQTRTSPPIKTNRYSALPLRPGDVELVDGAFLVPFSAEDTWAFKPDTAFYMDTSVTLPGTADTPQTPIVQLRMDRTLFENHYAEDDGGETE
jgi:hypothetical protein